MCFKIKITTYTKCKVKLEGKFEPRINDLANQSVEECYNKFTDDINEPSKNMIGYGRKKAINSLSKETKHLSKKKEHLGKKFLTFRILNSFWDFQN